MLDLITLGFVWRQIIHLHSLNEIFLNCLTKSSNKLVVRGFKAVNAEFVWDIMAVDLSVFTDVSECIAAPIILNT